jgi:hypothetical protein
MTTPNMGLALPTPGGDIGTWDDELNTALDLVDAHDHSAGKGVPIGVAGLNIGADLPLNGNSLVGIRSLDLDEVAALASGARRLFVSSADHELYYRTAAGVNVKLTNGASLNLSLVGGIVGDYAAIGAEVAYDDANDQYTFKQQLSAGIKQWARLAGAGVDLYEYKAAGDATNITKRVRHKSPAALAANYDVTWPAALPAAQVALQMDNAGVLVASNTFPQAVTFSNTVNLGTAVAAYTATGLITANAGLTGTTITASTDYLHSFKHKLGLPAALWQVVNAPAAVTTDGKSISLSTHAGDTTHPTANCGIPLKANDVITDIFVYVDKVSGAGTVTARFKSYNPLTGVTSDIANAAWPGAGNTISITGLSTTVVESVAYWVQIEGGGTTGDILYHASVRYTR